MKTTTQIFADVEAKLEAKKMTAEPIKAMESLVTAVEVAKAAGLTRQTILELVKSMVG